MVPTERQEAEAPGAAGREAGKEAEWREQKADCKLAPEVAVELVNHS